MKFNVIKLIFISILLIGCSDVNNQLYADTIDSNIQNINYTATGKSIDSEKLSCLDKEQNIIFLAPFDDADSTSHDYHISNDFKAIVQKLKDNGFCVDVIINKSVTYEIFQKLDNYRFVYINTHSNDRGDLTLPEEFKVDSLAEAVTKIGSGEIILKQHEVINVRSLITEGDRGFWRAIGVDFFNSLDFAKKNTLFFIHGCKALNIQPISPLSESILSSNAYGVIGFETYTSASWTERLNKEFFNNLLKKDSSAEEAIIETKANLSNSLLKDKLMALLGDINTLHLQKISDSDFILNSSGFRNSNSNSEYQTITSSTTGRVWMDRNLGADRVCTSEKDNDCYGDYYQWGRSTDGHESSTSSTTAITPSILFPNHDDFIRNNWDWTSSDSNGNTRNLNWNPCPEGFRIPTSIEFEAENIKDGADAYSKLKLPLSGNRHRTRASIDNTGSRGYIWSISPSSKNSKYLYFNASTSSVNNAHRSNGMGVRCIQEMKSHSPIAKAFVLPTTAQIGENISFSSEKSYDSNGYIKEYQWSTGSTILSNSASFVYSELAVGTHNIKLTVTDDDGVTSIDNIIIKIEDIPYSWEEAGWSICTGDCGTNNGIQTQIVICKDSDGNVAEESFCIEPKPLTSRSCIINECSDSNSNSEYQTITSSTTGRVWMDRNLGADRVCTSEKDNDCYGDYYQWGRSADGHESSTSSTTKTRSTILSPNHGDFIKNNSDWIGSDSNGNSRSLNWNPCPEGFRIPTSIEFEAENIKNGADAYSKLKLPLSGNRHRTRASIDNTGSRGYIWSISPYSRNSKYLYFNANTSSVNNAHRSNGMGVRCIQN